jgi:Flp pilus assembly protein TadG
MPAWSLTGIRRWCGSRQGQSMVETAMLLPVLAFLTFGLLDFGRAYYFQVGVTNAAREGARSGILDIYTGPQALSCSSANSYATCPVQTDQAIQNAVNAELSNTGIIPKSITICPPHDSSMSTAGCPNSNDRVSLWVAGTTTNYSISVNVKYDFQLYTPLLQNVVGNPVPMTVTVQMRTNY